MRWPGYVTLALVFTMGLTLQSDAQVYKIQPIGHVVKNDGKVRIEILAKYKDALLGLAFSSFLLCSAIFFISISRISLLLDGTPLSQ